MLPVIIEKSKLKACLLLAYLAHAMPFLAANSLAKKMVTTEKPQNEVFKADAGRQGPLEEWLESEFNSLVAHSESLPFFCGGLYATSKLTSARRKLLRINAISCLY